MTGWLDLDELADMRAAAGADRRLYEQWPAEPRRCDTRAGFGVQCPNEATLDVLDPDGEPTGTVACGPCSKAHPNLKYRRLKP